jgi:hypothetical protein
MGSYNFPLLFLEPYDHCAYMVSETATPKNQIGHGIAQKCLSGNESSARPRVTSAATRAPNHTSEIKVSWSCHEAGRNEDLTTSMLLETNASG